MPLDPPQSEPAKVNLVLLYTGILLLVLAGAAYLFKSEIFQGNVGFFFVRVFLSLGGGLVASQIPGILNVDIAPGIKAVGALAVVVLIFYFAPKIEEKPTTSSEPVLDLSGRWTRSVGSNIVEVYTVTADSTNRGYYNLKIDYDPDNGVRHFGSGHFLNNSFSEAEFRFTRDYNNCKMDLKSAWRKIDTDQFEECIFLIPGVPRCPDVDPEQKLTYRRIFRQK